MARKFWLMKSEPDEFSIDDLIKAENSTVHWDGIRNYQARNFMRDEMQPGDGVLFYHSRAKPLAVVGTMNVASEPYPDPTQFDPDSKYFDPKSTKENPRWMLVDVQFTARFDPPVTREQIKETAGLEDMMLIKKGSRLSIQPVTEQEWNIVHELAGRDPI
ncbi:EVE domain-containing protein [Natronogracilivirga saccharolytica]|nr:EVE domain-containing protein [Natronogracilivirga saccharolytica]